MTTPKCPKCQNQIVWRFVHPKKANYCCKGCGHVWPYYSTEEKDGKYGKFIGNWSFEEMDSFETNIEDSFPEYHAYVDWRFFKGKLIYTGWRETDKSKIIITKSIEELVYWVCYAERENNWYEQYEKSTKPRMPIDGLKEKSLRDIVWKESE